jgi:hypothetical protein
MPVAARFFGSARQRRTSTNRSNPMNTGQTNVGKKEQRQINQALTKAAQGDSTKQKVVDRIVPKQHRIKGRDKS